MTDGIAAPASPRRTSGEQTSSGEADDALAGLVRAEQDNFRRSLEESSGSYLAAQGEIIMTVSPDTVPMMEAIEGLTAGGKKMRALLCYWGWRSSGGASDDAGIVTAGMSLELFQAAALMHDDIIDRSDLRRGAPSVHKQFERRHVDGAWHLDSQRFGSAAAILVGDLCLSFSEEAFASIPGTPAALGTARRIFNRMRTEVMAGQYLDLLEEAVGPDREPSDAASRALSVLRFKSAKYSTEHPLCIGAALAGAAEAALAGYSAFALPLGEAFQLRDDLLGVYGDPQVTGKPAGDDLREGKRTVLVAKALQLGSPGEVAALNNALGRPDLTEEDVLRVRDIVDATGARDEVEELIAERARASYAALDALALDPLCHAAVSALAEAAVTRAA